MAQSITGSTNTPYNYPLVQDANYSVAVNNISASATVTSSYMDFTTATPFPSTENFVVNVYFSALTNTANSAVISASLQESADTINWTNVASLASPIITTTDNGAGAAPAAIVGVQLQPAAKRYLRLSVTTPTGGTTGAGATGVAGAYLTF